MKTTARRRRLWLAVLAALAAAQIGASSCTSGGGSNAPVASLELVVTDQIFYAGNAYVAVGYVDVHTSLGVQAYDLDFSWSPASPDRTVEIFPHSDFNDRGGFFNSMPVLDKAAGTATGYVDLRHGAGTDLSGTTRLLNVVVVVEDGGAITLKASGKVARPDGVVFATAPSPSVKLSGTPPSP